MAESHSRAFMYGESVFTTIRMINGQLKDWNYHFERLKKGVEFIYGPFIEGNEWVLLFKNRLEERTELVNGDQILRLSVFREQERGLIGTKVVSINDLKIHLASSTLEPQLPNQKLKLRTCSAPKRPLWWPEYLKAGNYLETILSQKLFMKPGDDDLLFLSNQDTVCCSSVANIFIVRHDNLYTPPSGPQVLAGVMRRKVMESATSVFSSCTEAETTIDQLFKADAIFGTNSLRGPFLIGSIDDFEIQYSQDFLDKFELLREKVLS